MGVSARENERESLCKTARKRESPSDRKQIKEKEKEKKTKKNPWLQTIEKSKKKKNPKKIKKNNKYYSLNDNTCFNGDRGVISSRLSWM